MKKIPTLFERKFEGHKIVDITKNVIDGMEWVLEGKGVATVKIDGACCAIIDGEFYKRYDAKKGKNPPKGAIPCCDPDPITGHHPFWAKVDANDPADRWFVEAERNSRYKDTQMASYRTYEAIGKHFNGNPYNLDHDTLVPHGEEVVEVPRTFEGIRDYLENHYIEGLVFWLDGEPKCKIKRSDFGFPWGSGRKR